MRENFWMTRRSLLEQFLREAPYQPATGWWRAIEIAHVVRHGLPVGRGLDLGCGDGKLTGIVTGELGRREFVGIDLDPKETDAARQTHLYTVVHTASAAAIPEPSASFDFVFSNSVLEHIPDIDAVVGEVARVLKPAGKFIFTVPGPDFHSCLGGPVFGDGPRYQRRIDQRCAHLRYWDREQWSTQLGRHGLSIQLAEGYMTAPEVRRWELLSNCTAGLLSALFQRRKRPIEIQRSLRLRESWVRLPAALVKVLAPAVSFGVALEEPQDGDAAGCLYIVSAKEGARGAPEAGSRPA